jgi:hypothetical protein
MTAALSPECSVSSTAHVVAAGHAAGSGRGQTVEAQGDCFL